jgi:hypothetical protein
MMAGLLRLKKRRDLLLILSEDTILNSRMTYCKRFAFIFARGWRRIALNESGGAMLWGENGGNRIFERWPEE